MNAAAGDVVWYVTGRFYETASDGSRPGTLQDVGYFLHLQGVEGKIFRGAMAERNALLTFSASPFVSPSIPNGTLNIGIDARGTFRVFLRDSPGASFEEPASFASGQCIATFERMAMVPTAKITLSDSATTLLSNVFTARLISSQPFDLDGRTYDFRALIGRAVTQWGTAATEPMTPPAGYVSVVPFVGSAVRAGQ